MIDLKPCRGCGRPLIYHSVANLAVRLEPTPLDLNGIMGELAASRSLWMVDEGKVRPARPGEAGPLKEHRCTATGAPISAPAVPTPQPTPQRPPAGRTTRSSGPSAAPSSVRSADSPRSDGGPRCDECGLIMQDGEYVSVQLGEIYVWAQHLTNCGRQT